MVKNMKEKLELKTHCLKKINSAAKAAGKLKQKSYDEQRYNDCSEYKKIQNQLYLIKSLTISDMEKKGELKVMPRVVDEFGTVLKSYASLDDKYFFHSISEHQEVGIFYKEGQYKQKSILLQIFSFWSLRLQSLACTPPAGYPEYKFSICMIS